MTLLPRSLLAQTALIIFAALLASQAVSLWIFNRYFAQPRQQVAVAGFGSHLKSISAALESIPAERHLEFISRLQEREGVRIVRVNSDPREAEIKLAPDVPIVRNVRDNLRNQFGAGADLYIRERNPNVMLVRLPVGENAYWVVFPRNRIERDSTLGWAAWTAFGMVVALAGAYWLVRRINRPLRDLASAARSLGSGTSVPALWPAGPPEIRAVAQAFNQMQEDLGRQARERATFLAGVSHDLRTPLARLRLNLEMLGDKVDVATQADMVADIGDMDQIIGQFLDYAREESAEAAVALDLNALAEQAATRASRRGLTLTLELGALSGPLQLRPVAMQRLIDNLLDNAAKHAGGELLLRTSEPGREVTLSLLDRGPGVPADQVERLKQPFTRLDAARGGAIGAGLGLAIVERIAKLHAARFDLLARDGGGLEARITFPR